MKTSKTIKDTAKTTSIQLLGEQVKVSIITDGQYADLITKTCFHPTIDGIHTEHGYKRIARQYVKYASVIGYEEYISYARSYRLIHHMAGLTDLIDTHIESAYRTITYGELRDMAYAAYARGNESYGDGTILAAYAIASGWYAIDDHDTGTSCIDNAIAAAVQLMSNTCSAIAQVLAPIETEAEVEATTTETTESETTTQQVAADAVKVATKSVEAPTTTDDADHWRKVGEATAEGRITTFADYAEATRFVGCYIDGELDGVDDEASHYDYDLRTIAEAITCERCGMLALLPIYDELSDQFERTTLWQVIESHRLGGDEATDDAIAYTTDQLAEALEAAGLKRWTKGSMDRMYANPSVYGVEYDYYKTGNIRSCTITIDGDEVRVSNAEGARFKLTKAYVDLADASVHVKTTTDYEEHIAATLKAIVVDAIATITATTTTTDETTADEREAIEVETSDGSVRVTDDEAIEAIGRTMADAYELMVASMATANVVRVTWLRGDEVVAETRADREPSDGTDEAEQPTDDETTTASYLTEAQISALEAAGFRRWQKFGHDRLYYDGQCFDGGIYAIYSEAEAKAWIDIKTGDLHARTTPRAIENHVLDYVGRIYHDALVALALEATDADTTGSDAPLVACAAKDARLTVTATTEADETTTTDEPYATSPAGWVERDSDTVEVWATDHDGTYMVTTECAWPYYCDVLGYVTASTDEEAIEAARVGWTGVTGFLVINGEQLAYLTNADFDQRIITTDEMAEAIHALNLDGASTLRVQLMRNSVVYFTNMLRDSAQDEATRERYRVTMSAVTCALDCLAHDIERDERATEATDSATVMVDADGEVVDDGGVLVDAEGNIADDDEEVRDTTAKAYSTISEVETEVIATLGDFADQYNIEGIALEISGWDEDGRLVADIERDDYWHIVAQYAC